MWQINQILNSAIKRSTLFKRAFSHHTHGPGRGPLQRPRHKRRQSRSHKVLAVSQEECCPLSAGSPTRNTVSDWPTHIHPIGQYIVTHCPFWQYAKTQLPAKKTGCKCLSDSIGEIHNEHGVCSPAPCCSLVWEWWFSGCSALVPGSTAHTYRTEWLNWLALIGPVWCLSSLSHTWIYSKDIRCTLSEKQGNKKPMISQVCFCISYELQPRSWGLTKSIPALETVAGVAAFRWEISNSRRIEEDKLILSLLARVRTWKK